MVRDTALSVSGLLVEKFGGPSVEAVPARRIHGDAEFPKREYSASRGEDLYRRGVYTFWQRTFLHPSLLTFDAPTREECTINRVKSNTPLQALVLLNDPIYVEAARVFAENIVQHGHALNDRVNWAFRARARPRPDRRRSAAFLEDLYRKSLARVPRGRPAMPRASSTRRGARARSIEAGGTRRDDTVARAILNLRNDHEELTHGPDIRTNYRAPHVSAAAASRAWDCSGSTRCSARRCSRQGRAAWSIRCIIPRRPSASSSCTRPAGRRISRRSTTSRSSPR